MLQSLCLPNTWLCPNSSGPKLRSFDVSGMGICDNIDRGEDYKILKYLRMLLGIG